jgi:AcrR family transcriptional regulator
MKSRYTSALRQSEKASTRALILKAVQRSLKDHSLGELSLATVAREAGVTERTVYRHFETRQQLLDATWDEVNDAIGMKDFPRSAEELVVRPITLFPAFAKHEEVIRAMLSSPQGRELRLRANKERQVAIRAVVKSVRAELRGPALTRLCAAVQALCSASGWATMTDYWGLDSVEAGRAASDAIAALLGLKAQSNLVPSR